MSFRDSLRRLATKVRAIPGKLGARPYSVAVQVQTWSGSEAGEGTATTVSTPVTEHDGQPPKVRWLTNQQLSLGGYEDGTVEVGPITPDHPGGGMAIATLYPQTSATPSTVRWILTGPMYPSGGKFRVRDFRHDRSWHYTVTLERAAD